MPYFLKKRIKKLIPYIVLLRRTVSQTTAGRYNLTIF
nr:MAG TPA: hypothetical protein [Caudoviricetes sp.]